jgi:hypothetical protein
MSHQQTYRHLPRLLLLTVSSAFLLAQSAGAATVHNCTLDRTRCVVKLEAGSVGDQVRVLDQTARPIAKGHLVKRKGAFGIIALTDVTQEIRRGFPVIVDTDSKTSATDWAAEFSNRQ